MKKEKKTNGFSKNLALWLGISIIMILLFNLLSSRVEIQQKITFTDFLDAVESNSIKEVVIQGEKITGRYVDNREFKTYSPYYPNLVHQLNDKRIKITAKPKNESSWFITLLASWFPMILLVGVWIFFMRQMQVGGGKAMSFGKSKAKILAEQENKVTFENVAGIDEAKEELQEIIAFLKDPQKFTRLGGRIPKGVLLMGAPGTGKTLLAKAIAGEANVPFFSISGSDFVEMFVGVGASRVRDLFIQGKKNAPCIIFIDEIDAVGRHRGAGLGGGHDEREQTLNQLLVEMDGFETSGGVIIISATNRPDILDPALLRPGRFDRQVVVPSPDVKGRGGILKVHTKNMPLAEDVDLEILARGTPGFTGADLSNMVNESALIAAREDKKEIEMKDFEFAKDKVMMGIERRSLIISEAEKKITAYHEAGHALVAKLIPDTDPIHKVTIVPRGHALGLTQQLPIDERHTYSRRYLIDKLTILLGGRASEEIVLEDLTTGAGKDIEKATEIARKMICEWGMSEAMGPLSFGKKEEQIFLGREIAQHRDYSEITAVKIDEEVKNIVVQCYETAKNLLKENIDVLHTFVEKLLEKEVLDGPEIDSMLKECGVITP
ncbi:MAG: ATP-dependent zinc metalloprotease FtsH [Thermodesulfobacteriota bacterium]|nr:ATP-dependent zinc metalloprotease FtsH [Thermodesulfobacteriota bacterium]